MPMIPAPLSPVPPLLKAPRSPLWSVGPRKPHHPPVLAAFFKVKSKGLKRRLPSAEPRVKAPRYSGRPASWRRAVQAPSMCVTVCQQMRCTASYHIHQRSLAHQQNALRPVWPLIPAHLLARRHACTCTHACALGVPAVPHSSSAPPPALHVHLLCRPTPLHTQHPRLHPPAPPQSFVCAQSGCGSGTCRPQKQRTGCIRHHQTCGACSGQSSPAQTGREWGRGCDCRGSSKASKGQPNDQHARCSGACAATAANAVAAPSASPTDTCTHTPTSLPAAPARCGSMCQ